jgi:hypothetical protein
VSEVSGGAGLTVLEATLVFEELGRVLASVPLLGHLPATLLLDRAGSELTAVLAAGHTRAAFRPRAPADRPRRGLERRPAARPDPRHRARARRWPG